MNEAASLGELALASTSFSEKEALRRRARAILVPVHALLLRRLADNTLLPGTNTEEEVTYHARSLAFTIKAKEQPVPSEAVYLQSLGVLFGYETLLYAVFDTLTLLIELRGSALLRESVHSFVLTALDAIPRTATITTTAMVTVALAALQHSPMGAAAPPSRIGGACLALKWLLVPTLAAGLCLPASVC